MAIGINPPPNSPKPAIENINQHNAVNRKPKLNRKGGALDNCYTPPHALKPLLSFISGFCIWESAPGEGFMVEGLLNQVDHATIVHNDKDFFTWQPDDWDIQVTNPPYSRKYEWLRRSYALGKPFALLLPVESIGAAQGNTLIAEFGAEFILMTQRINFHMSNKGYEGSAQFPVLWWTHGLNLGKTIRVWDNKTQLFLN
jgi:hypothetical protein